MTPYLEDLIAKAKNLVKHMTPTDREAMLDEQAKSWVRGEMGMGSDKDEAIFKAALESGDTFTLARLLCHRFASLSR
jgi:hypothetical protein